MSDHPEVLNDDPAAIPADEYWADLEKDQHEHPITGPSPDEYELDDD